MSKMNRPFSQFSKDVPPQEEQCLLSLVSQANLFIICICIILLSLLKLTAFFTDLFSMLAGALILSYLLQGSVHRVARLLGKTRFISTHVQTGLAIFVVYLALLLTVTVGLISIAPKLSHQLKEFTKDIPTQLSQLDLKDTDAVKNTTPLFIPKPHPLPLHLTSSSGSIGRINNKGSLNLDFNYKKYLRLIWGYYQHYLSNIGSILLQLGTGTINSLVYLLTSFVLVFYLLSGGQALKNDAVNLLPKKHRQFALQLLNHLHLHFEQVIRGQIALSLFAGVTMYCMLLLLGVKYQLLLSLFFCISSLLPIIGVCIGLFPIILLVVFSGHPSYLVIVTVVMAVFFLLKTYWFVPQLIHKQNRIHPVMLILTFMICLKLVGASGILLFFPVASIINVSLQTLRNIDYQH